MTHRIFVYGTLKEGFRNFHVNAGRQVPGAFRSVERLPLYLVGPWALPWLVNEAGQGHRVWGQLFEVEPPDLVRMDALERTGQPGWYTRSALQVQCEGDAGVVDAEVYFGCRSRLADGPVLLGPLAEYTLAHQALYRGPGA